MALKITALILFLAYANVGTASIAYTPITKAVVDTEYDHNPQYTYSYGVEDAITGDSKSQTETRSGDIVTGQYSLIEPDGSKRIVDYTADPINGFNAVVRKAAPAVSLTYTTPIVARIPSATYVNPVLPKLTTPVAYTSPYISKLAVPTTAGLNSFPYATVPITKTIIQGPSTVSHATPLVYSTHLGNTLVTGASAFYPYSSYTPVYTEPVTYPKVHY